MNAKNFLLQAKRMDRQIDNYVLEIVQLLELATKITPSLEEKVQTSGIKDKVGDCSSKIADLRKELNIKVDTLIEKVKEIQNVIEKVEDENCCNLLFRRYILYQKWEEIAVDMGYSTMGIWKMHGRALKEVEKILKSLL